jgi:hypothetical protein
MEPVLSLWQCAPYTYTDPGRGGREGETQREREGETLCVCVCVRERERERKMSCDIVAGILEPGEVDCGAWLCFVLIVLSASYAS